MALASGAGAADVAGAAMVSDADVAGAGDIGSVWLPPQPDAPSRIPLTAAATSE